MSIFRHTVNAQIGIPRDKNQLEINPVCSTRQATQRRSQRLDGIKKNSTMLATGNELFNTLACPSMNKFLIFWLMQQIKPSDGIKLHAKQTSFFYIAIGHEKNSDSLLHCRWTYDKNLRGDTQTA